MRTNGHGKPVVALDIDGTLGDYHGHFLNFAAAWFGHPMPNPREINPGQRLHMFMGVPLARYRECKLAYRQGGLKRSMPVYDGAARLTECIRSAGAEVWICTTRPYLRLDNIDPDTREWLRRNRIRYDAVLFGDDKYQELRRQAKSRIAAILEDLPELVVTADKLLPKVPIFLRDQPYNRHFKFTYDARVYNMEDAWNSIGDAIIQWKETH
jgi:hypothetical protein